MAFPFGMDGIFKNLPFAIWFYLAIEELPLAAEESMDPQRDIPKGDDLGTADADHLRGRDPVPEHGHRTAGAAGIGATAEPLFVGFQDDLR